MTYQWNPADFPLPSDAPVAKNAGYKWNPADFPIQPDGSAPSSSSTPVNESSNPLVNFGKGALSAVQGMVRGAVNPVIEGLNAYTQNPARASSLPFGSGMLQAALTAGRFPAVSQVPTLPASATNGSGVAYDLGNIGGNIAGFLGGGELLDSIRGLSEGLPVVGRGAEWLGQKGLLPSIARRASGSALYGAATNPNAPGTGAAEGAAASTALDLLPAGLGAAGKLAPLVRPNQYLGQILAKMGGGQSLENNAKSIASDIHNAFNQRIGEANALYKPVFDSGGNNLLYGAGTEEKVAPSEGVTSLPPFTSAYQAIDNGIINSYDRNLGKLHTQFNANPTFQNAHNLQSQLGTAIRKLNKADVKGNLSVADRSVMQGYQEAQGALRTDMNNFLDTMDPSGGLKGQYKAAQTHFATNVAPYLEDPKIAPIAKGEITNPRNIANIFKNPEPETEQIVEDMGANAPNKILYSELGKYNVATDPEQFLRATEKLEQKGLGSYVTPSLADQLNILSNRIRNKKGAQMIGGGLIGLGLAHPFGSLIPHSIPELVGAGIGGGLGRFLGKRVEGSSPLWSAAKGVSTSAKALYPYLSKALLANTIPGVTQ